MYGNRVENNMIRKIEIPIIFSCERAGKFLYIIQCLDFPAQKFSIWEDKKCKL